MGLLKSNGKYLFNYIRLIHSNLHETIDKIGYYYFSACSVFNRVTISNSTPDVDKSNALHVRIYVLVSSGLTQQFQRTLHYQRSVLKIVDYQIFVKTCELRLHVGI